MKMITAIIKPKQLDNVRYALGAIEVAGITVTRVEGFGRQKGYTEQYRGATHKVDFLDKVKLEIACSKDKAQQIVDTIIASAKTNGGKIGDGKIFITNLEDVVRIRTGETGSIAI